MRLHRLLAASLLLAAIAPGVPSSGDPPAPPLGHRGRWLIDAEGRTVILHGLNVVSKLPPYDPAAIGFGEDDAAFLEAEGFNTVRLGLIYKALEPARGVYDDAYLSSIAQTARMLGEHGMKVVVDFHQDMFNERFNGEGFPDWAVRDDGLPPQPDGGFPANYFVMPALWRAYDHLWANDAAPDGTPLQDAFAAAWRHAAERFRAEPAVAGYDTFNEPWPGSAWPTCLNPDGCRLFDATLTAFFARVFAAIRQADPGRLVFYETHPIFGGGADVHFGDTGDDAAGFSFHVYCLGATVGIPSELLGDASCPLGEDRPFDNADAQAARTGDTLLLSEFGATDDLGTIARDTAAADRHMVSWQYWTWWGRDPCCERPHEGIIIDPSQPPVPANIKQAKMDVLARTYPRAVAGTPLSFAFHPERTDRLFEMTFEADPTITAPTEIAVPVARHYPGGYTVTITGPAQLTSAPGAALVTLASTGTGEVHVTITR